MPADRLTLLAGTGKGAFLVSGPRDDAAPNGGWTVSGPHCDGWPINHVVADPDSGTLWAGGGGDWNGAGVWRSTDGGENWTLARLTKGQIDDFAADDPDIADFLGWTPGELPFGDSFSQIWSLAFAHGALYAGTKPAGLLVSHDGGASWEKIHALTDHPSAENWTPGGAGLVLHTILAHPQRPGTMWVGISAAGVFATEDGGKSWERRNRLSNLGACADHPHPAGPRDGETGHCIHNMMLAPSSLSADPAAASGPDTGIERLYQQNHHGVWRSVDGGRSWDDITAGLPSTFGFPIRVHPRDPETIWTLPLNGDMAGRFPPDAAAAVWRSRDGGRSWQALRDGLPQTGCYFTVLRQAMAGGARDPAGIYFGTNSGSVFASFDEGDCWHEVARHLPTILSLEAFDRA